MAPLEPLEEADPVRSELGALMNERHLIGSQMEVYRDQFRQHPLKIIQIRNCLKPKIADQIAKYLAEEAQYSTIYGLYSRKPHQVDETEWLNAPDEDRIFIYDMIDRSEQPPGFAPTLLQYLKLRKLVDTEAFRSFAMHVCDISVNRTNVAVTHKFDENQFLRRHNDKSGNRKIAFILYLTPNWQSEYGGALHIVGKSNEEAYFQPEFNSLVMFDVQGHDYHEIQQLKQLPDGVARYTLGGWFGFE